MENENVVWKDTLLFEIFSTLACSIYLIEFFDLSEDLQE